MDFDARCRPIERNEPNIDSSTSVTKPPSVSDLQLSSSSSSSRAVGTIPLPLSVAVSVSKTGNRNPYVYNLDDVTSIFTQLLKKQLVEDSSLMVVRSGYDSPVSFEGRSCVYVLVMQRDFFPDSLYVGETESIQQRLKQHRCVWMSWFRAKHPTLFYSSLFYSSMFYSSLFYSTLLYWYLTPMRLEVLVARYIFTMTQFNMLLLISSHILFCANYAEQHLREKEFISLHA